MTLRLSAWVLWGRAAPSSSVMLAIIIIMTSSSSSFMAPSSLSLEDRSTSGL
jgi:hypothetical protein